mmetsp:Transcript_7410/g.21579  ORF Transcript_7410/g.21579 Transcript_7410/m.21579 type:complete len:371 (-) Transcript_7410:453-1565(-)
MVVVLPVPGGPLMSVKPSLLAAVLMAWRWLSLNFAWSIASKPGPRLTSSLSLAFSFARTLPAPAPCAFHRGRCAASALALALAFLAWPALSLGLSSTRSSGMRPMWFRALSSRTELTSPATTITVKSFASLPLLLTPLLAAAAAVPAGECGSHWLCDAASVKPSRLCAPLSAKPTKHGSAAGVNLGSAGGNRCSFSSSASTLFGSALALALEGSGTSPSSKPGAGAAAPAAPLRRSGSTLDADAGSGLRLVRVTIVGLTVTLPGSGLTFVFQRPVDEGAEALADPMPMRAFISLSFAARRFAARSRALRARSSAAAFWRCRRCCSRSVSSCCSTSRRRSSCFAALGRVQASTAARSSSSLPKGATRQRSY